MPTVEEVKPEAEGPSDVPEEVKPEPDLANQPPNIPPASLPSTLQTLDGDEDDDDDDETLAERLLGLGEMFPQPIRTVTSSVAGFSWNSAKWLYSAGRVAAWVVASSAVILALPVMFESERAQMEEQQLQQQRQILLGPNAAVSGAGAGLGAMPQVLPPGQAR